jgi:hypothetical protein
MLTARYVLKNVIPSFCDDAHAAMIVELQTKPFFRITLQTYLIKEACTFKYARSVMIMERTRTRSTPPKQCAWASDRVNEVIWLRTPTYVFVVNHLF